MEGAKDHACLGAPCAVPGSETCGRVPTGAAPDIKPTCVNMQAGWEPRGTKLSWHDPRWPSSSRMHTALPAIARVSHDVKRIHPNPGARRGRSVRARHHDQQGVRTGV